MLSEIQNGIVPRFAFVESALKREPVSLDTYVTDDLCIQDYVEDTSYSSPENNAQKLLQQNIV